MAACTVSSRGDRLPRDNSRYGDPTYVAPFKTELIVMNTELLCITGDLDPNVEALQSQEIHYALRRLGKMAVWLRYHNGAHGGPHDVEERRDMYTRMLEWYDTYLKPIKEKLN